MGKFIKKPTRKTWVYICTVILSLSLLYLGNQMVSPNIGIYAGAEQTEGTPETFTASVQRVIGESYEETTLGIASKLITFEAYIKDGSAAGRTVAATQRLDGLLPVMAKEVQQGDTVLLVAQTGSDGEEEFVFSDYYRIDPLIWLGIAFLGLLILFGRKEGVNTVLSLVLTCLAIFIVFIPSVLCGWNIYLMSIAICIYVILMTLMLVSGPTKKTAVAAAGCFGGLAVSGILTAVMTVLLNLSGAVDEDSVYLLFLETPIDLKAVIFAAILIGAMGAIMDVAMSLSSALLEITEKAPQTTMRELIRSGFSIGRDMMATMSNTLVLAYIGCALSVVLLLVSYNSSLQLLLNKEMIVVEILQALVGSLGILSTIPITTCFASYLYIGLRHIKEKKM